MAVWNVMMRYEDVAAGIRERGCCAGKVNPMEYHAWKARLAGEFGCPVVSKSALHDFAENVYRYHYNLTHGVRKESAGFRMGSMVDTLVLTPELWDKLYVAEEVDARTKAGKARKAELEGAGLALVKPEESEQARAVAGQASAHLKDCGLALGETFRSQIGLFLYVDELDGAKLPVPLLVTGMVDICPDAGSAEGAALWDLKTTSKDPSAKEGLFYAIEDFRYGIQAAMYLDMFNVCTGEGREAFAFLFVGTAAPAMSCVVRLSQGDIDVFRVDYKSLLRRYSLACAEDDWGEPALADAFYVPTRREAARFSNLMEG